MTDNLVERLQKTYEHYARTGMDRFAAMQAKECKARIQELEAKMEKAEIIIRIIASDKWDERLGEAVDLACEYLAEIKGENT